MLDENTTKNSLTRSLKLAVLAVINILHTIQVLRVFLNETSDCFTPKYIRNLNYILGEATLHYENELDYIYPDSLLYEFSKKAVNHYENGKQRELLGYVIGYKRGQTLIGTELIFPTQSYIKPTRNDGGNCTKIIKYS